MFHEVLFDRLCSLFLCSQAGSSIPSVSLFVVNLYGPAHTLEMMPPDSLRARYYISVNVKKTRINLDDFRHHLPEMIAHPDFFSPSLPLSLSLSLLLAQLSNLFFFFFPVYHFLHRLFRDSYISMVTWISSTRLAVRWLNRAQNQSVLCVCEATTGACSEVSGHQSLRISNPSRPRRCTRLLIEFLLLLPLCVGRIDFLKLSNVHRPD